MNCKCKCSWKCNPGDRIISGGYTAPLPSAASETITLAVAENLVGTDTYQVHLSILRYNLIGVGSIIDLTAPSPTLTVNCFNLPP